MMAIRRLNFSLCERDRSSGKLAVMGAAAPSVRGYGNITVFDCPDRVKQVLLDTI